VQVGRRLVLVGNSGSEMSSLWPDRRPDEVAEVLGQVAQDKGGSGGASFRALFGRAGKPYAEPEPDDDEPDHPEAPAVQTAVDGGTDPAREDLSGLSEQVRRIAKPVSRRMMRRPEGAERLCRRARDPKCVKSPFSRTHDENGCSRQPNGAERRSARSCLLLLIAFVGLPARAAEPRVGTLDHPPPSSPPQAAAKEVASSLPIQLPDP